MDILGELKPLIFFGIVATPIVGVFVALYSKKRRNRIVGRCLYVVGIVLLLCWFRFYPPWQPKG
jgi:hypothetical protein